MLRNNYILPTAGLVRLGYSSNDSVYSPLGHADTFELAQAEESRCRHRSYSVPRTVLQDSTMEHISSSMKNAKEPDTEPLGTVFPQVLEEPQEGDCSPFLLFTEEQRTAILDTARQPDMRKTQVNPYQSLALTLWLQG